MTWSMRVGEVRNLCAVELFDRCSLDSRVREPSMGRHRDARDHRVFSVTQRFVEVWIFECF